MPTGDGPSVGRPSSSRRPSGVVPEPLRAGDRRADGFIAEVAVRGHVTWRLPILRARATRSTAPACSSCSSLPLSPSDEPDADRFALALNDIELTREPLGYGFGSYAWRDGWMYFSPSSRTRCTSPGCSPVSSRPARSARGASIPFSPAPTEAARRRRPRPRTAAGGSSARRRQRLTADAWQGFGHGRSALAPASARPSSGGPRSRSAAAGGLSRRGAQSVWRLRAARRTRRDWPSAPRRTPLRRR